MGSGWFVRGAVSEEEQLSLCCLQASLWLWLLLLLLLLVEDDADDVSLVLFHVIHQPLFTGGLEAADTAAEQKHAILHAWARGLACACLALGMELYWILPLGAWRLTWPLGRICRGCRGACWAVCSQGCCCCRWWCYCGCWQRLCWALGFVLWGLAHCTTLCHWLQNCWQLLRSTEERHDGRGSKIKWFLWALFEFFLMFRHTFKK